jgi:hypothetical protein
MKHIDDFQPALLAMLKAPRPGLVKTRLAQEVGSDSAAAIYRRLVEHQMAAIPRDWRVEVHYAPEEAGVPTEFQQWLGAKPSYHPQLGANLGDRLIHAIAGAFDRGAERVIVIGGDCPGLDEPTLRDALSALGSVDVVIGPALDGGYYLIGLKRPTPDLFRGITWSSSTVFSSTLSRMREAGLSHATLPCKEDVDDVASWRRLEYLIPTTEPSVTANCFPPMNPERLSVVIPALNEARVIGQTLERVRAALPGAGIFVVDGGSTDETVGIATQWGGMIVPSPRGRGIQCHAGAMRTASEWLLFLHADTLLPVDALHTFDAFAAKPANQLGTFRLQFADGGKFLNALAWAAHRGDSVFTRFGDQGVLVRRSFYDALGGFPPWPLFEDVALFQRARKLTRVHWLPGHVVTSARRFNERGLFRQRLLNAELLLRYLGGASPFELAARYHRPSRSEPTSPGFVHPNDASTRA